MPEIQRECAEVRDLASFTEYLARAVSLQQSTHSAERDFVHVRGELGAPFCIRGAGQKSHPLDFSFQGCVHRRSEQKSDVSYRHHVTLDSDEAFDVLAQADYFFMTLQNSLLQYCPDLSDNLMISHENGSLDADFWLQQPYPSREYTV